MNLFKIVGKMAAAAGAGTVKAVQVTTEAPVKGAVAGTNALAKASTDLEINLGRKVVGGIIRHLVTTAGGGLVAHGMTSMDDVQMAAGAAATLAGIGWSILAKKYHILDIISE